MIDQPIQPTHQYANLTEDELRQAFLTAAQGTNMDANRFFDRFKYKNDLFGGNAAAALNQGLELLGRCHSIDETAFAHIHKGTPYYWIGIAAFLMHEIELATFFFDASVAEDLRAGAHPVNNPTPSLRFILIEAEPLDQAGRELVWHTQARFEELIAYYNEQPGHLASAVPLTISDVRERFLRPAITPGRENLRSSATTFISFNMEWDFRNLLFDIRPTQGTAEPFFLHLFKGCILFESLLKGNIVKTPPVTSTLGNILQYLHRELGIPNDFGIGNTDFPSIISDLAGADDTIQTAIQFTGRIRNTLGHNLGWVVPLDQAIYRRLFLMVSSSCLHVISCLYP